MAALAAFYVYLLFGKSFRPATCAHCRRQCDPLLIVAALPFFSPKLPIIYVVMEKKEYRQNWTGWRRWLYGGSFFEWIGGYEAYRGLNDYQKALRHHLRFIDTGKSVGIFPVGRRHGVHETSQARGGVAYMAKKTGLPVIPVRIQGIDKNTRLSSYLLRRPKLRITFGAPVYAGSVLPGPGSVDAFSRADFEQAAVRIMEQVAALE
jgi:1-acyl-sn-glycerol-3-phosphate acyltransferase